MVTNKFLKPASGTSAKEAIGLDEVATSIASKEAPLHASQTNSSWEIFLVIMLLVAGACVFAKYDVVKLKSIAIWEWPTYFDPELKLKGIKLNISKWQRPPQNSSPWESKAAGLYMICTLSKHQAEKDGYTDSLMLDHEGNIAEATSANIFFKDKNNELHTPIPDSFLDGITRKTVIDLAKSKNIKINERKISPKELSNFKGCFITGTAAEITPVGNILDNNFEVCDLIKDLSTSYETLVGKNN